MLSWSLTTAETEGLRLCLAPTPLPGNAFALLWAQAGAGEGQNGTIPPPSSSCYCRWLGGGSLLNRGPQPWPQPWAVVQGSKVTSKSGTACGQCLAKVPGSCRAILGAGQAAGMDAPSPALCSIRRGAQAQGQLSQGAGLPALAPTGLSFYFLLMTFLFSLGGLRSGISRNHHGMSFLRRKQSPRLLLQGGISPRSSHRGASSPLGHVVAGTAGCKPAILQLGSGYSGLDPCSQLSRQMCSEGTGTETGRTYKDRSSILWPPHHFLFWFP